MNLILHLTICILVFVARLVYIVTDDFYPDERDALLILRDSLTSTLNLHSKWTGPPCTGSRNRWIGITCWNSHVTEIVLYGIQLTGSLSPTFLYNVSYLSKLNLRNNSLHGPLPNLTSLFNLQVVDFSHNRFSRSIPLGYKDFPHLTQLQLQQNFLNGNIPPFDQQSLVVFNVSHNLLEGPIPETRVLQRYPMSSYDHNAGLCGKPLGNPCPTTPPSSGSPTSAPVTPPPPAKKKVIHVWKIALIMAAGLVVPLAIMLVCCYHHWKKHVQETTEEYISGENLAERTETRDSTGLERLVGLEFFNKERQVFNIDELLRASAETMGKGNLGRMYKVTLESGCVLAVKRLKDINGTSKEEFIQQMHLLGKLRHQNLLEIISFYYAKDEKLIINEYVNGGSLFDLLHENRGVGRIPLNWSRRLSIVIGVARGLAYLHQSLPSHKIPHANLKSSNVLVQLHDDDDDDNNSYHPKLTDFGFQPLLTSPNSAQKLAASKSPEFSKGKKKLTHKADVYCFGLLLLEIITGKVAGDDEDDLSEWVRLVVSNSWSTDILDLEILATNQGHEEMLKLTEIALECTAAEPERRPTMDELLRRIEEFQVVDNDESN